jgi:RNA polymerase-binding transcription factor
MAADAPIGEALAERARELREELRRLTERPPDAPAPVSFGKRVGDGTTEAVERISTTAAARSIAASLAEADRAIEKLAEGTYGTCDVCGAPIAAERLEAIPWTSLCVACAGARSRAAR